MNEKQKNSLDRAEKAIADAQAEIAKIKEEIKKENSPKVTKADLKVGNFLIITDVGVEVVCRVTANDGRYADVKGMRNGAIYEANETVLADTWGKFRLPKSIEDFNLIEKFLLAEAEQSGICDGDLLMSSNSDSIIYSFKSARLDALQPRYSTLCNSERTKLGHSFFLNVSHDIYASP